LNSFPFRPTATQAFQFTASLDGADHTVTVTWNLSGKRWFINVHDSDRNLVLCRSLVASPAPRALASRLGALPVSSMSWTSTDGGRVAFVMIDDVPAQVHLGGTVNVSGALNNGTAGNGAVNGTFVLDQYSDAKHFSALLTASAGEIDTISGNIILNIAAYALTWRRGTVTAITAEDHGLPLGSVVRLTIDNVTPVGYNGLYYCVVSGPREFRYRLLVDPGGPATRSGNYSCDINLLSGYLTQSSLIYRDASNQFEVRP
jgi:hypothetical protein